MNILRKRPGLLAIGLSSQTDLVEAIGFLELRGMFIGAPVRDAIHDTFTFKAEGADHANR